MTEQTSITPPGAPVSRAPEPNYFGRLTTPQRVSGVAILIVALAAFLPWASVFGFSVNGIEGDGVLTLVFALAGAAILAIATGLVTSPRIPESVSQVALLVLGLFVALIALMNMNGAAAIGLYLTLMAGIAWVGGAGWQLSLTRQANVTG